MITIMSVWGLFSTLGAVDHTAQMFCAGTGNLVQRGFGNFLIMLFFGVLMGIAIYKPIVNSNLFTQFLDNLTLKDDGDE